MKKKVFTARVEKGIAPGKYDTLMDEMNGILAKYGEEIDDYLTDDDIYLIGCTENVAQIIAGLDGITALELDVEGTADYLEDMAKDAEPAKPASDSVTDRFMAAVRNKQTAEAEKLLDEGADLHYSGGFPVIVAASQGDLATVDMLLAHGANPDARCGAAFRSAAQYPEVIVSLTKAKAAYKR